MRRIVIAGLLGGIIVFMWSAIAHTVLPLGEAGLAVMPNEEAVIGTLRENLTEEGIYLFPGMQPGVRPSAAEQSAWEERTRRGPWGLVVFHPGPGDPSMGRRLGMELGANVAAALLLAWVLSRLVGSWGARTLAAALLGGFAWLSISASHWIWYGFPASFELAELADQVVGWLLAGALTARLVPAPRLQR